MTQRARFGKLRGAWPLLALLAVLLAAMAAPRAGSGAASAPATGEKWTKVQLVYHSDSDGFIDPCG